MSVSLGQPNTTPRPVADIKPGASHKFLFSLTAVGNTLFFSQNTGSGHELWKSDGTAAGAVLVADIGQGPYGSIPLDLTAVGDTLFFSADDGSSGRELWKSDGTAAGTVRVADIGQGASNSSPRSLTAVGDTLFFSANDGSSGYELWKSDGTAAGTVRVADISPGRTGSYPRDLTVVGDTLFFSANIGSGRELWKSDGTAAGTVLVADIGPGSSSSYPRNLTAVGDTLFFSADDGSSGIELWKSDGTAAGTVLIADISPGRTGSYPLSLTPVGDTLFFSADDGSSGIELWKSDGTAAGTVRVADIRPGPYGSEPLGLTPVGDTLFFLADDGSSGFELWALDIEPPSFTSGSTASPVYPGIEAGRVIYTAKVSSGSKATYSFSEDPADDHGFFSINPDSGEIAIKKPPVDPQKASYQMTVVATNSTGSVKQKIATRPAPHPWIIEAFTKEFENISLDPILFETNGSIRIGRRDGLYPLINVFDTKKTTMDAASLQMERGTVYSAIGGVSQSLFTADISLPYVDNRAVLTNVVKGDFRIAGQEVEFKSMTLLTDKLAFDIRWKMPDALSGLIVDTSESHSQALQISEDRVQPLANFKITRTDVKGFRFLNLVNVNASDMSFEFRAAENAIRFQGLLSLTNSQLTRDSRFRSIVFNLTGPNYAQLNSDSDIVIVGKLRIDAEIPLGKGFSISDVELSIDRVNSKISGTGVLNTPWGMKFGQGKGIKPTIGFITNPSFQLDQVELDILAINRPIQAMPYIFFNSIGIGIDNIAPFNSRDSVAKIRGALTLGPEINSTTLAKAQLEAIASKSQIEGTYTIDYLSTVWEYREYGKTLALYNGPMIRGVLQGTLDWSKETLSGKKQINIWDGLIVDTIDFSANSRFDFAFGRALEIAMPSFLPVWGGKKLVGGQYAVNFSNDNNLANDYIAFWGNLLVVLPVLGYTTLTVGMRIGFDRKISRIGAGNIPSKLVAAPPAQSPSVRSFALSSLVDDPAPINKASFQIAASEPFVLFTAMWEKAVDNVKLRLVKPDNSLIEEQDFAQYKITYLTELSSVTVKTVAVSSPDAGLWTLELVAPADLGVMNFEATGQVVSPSFSFTGDPVYTDGKITFTYNCSGLTGGANISVFYATQPGMRTGLLAGSFSISNEGTGSFQWNPEKVPPGSYYLYAAIDDGKGPIIYSDLATPINAGKDTDLALSIRLNGSKSNGNHVTTFDLSVDNLTPNDASDVSLILYLRDEVVLGETMPGWTKAGESEYRFSLGSIAAGKSAQYSLSLGSISLDSSEAMLFGDVAILTSSYDSNLDNNRAILDLNSANDFQATFSISGTPAIGNTLLATNSSPDPDGNGPFSYRWQSSTDGTTWSPVGTNSPSYLVASADQGKQLRLVVSYTDGQGFSEAVTTPAGSVPLVNDGAASFSIFGTPVVGNTLTATTSSPDPDGNGAFTYSWQASTNGTTWSPVGTNSPSYLVASADHGKQLRLVVSYTDGQGFPEAVTGTIGDDGLPPTLLQLRLGEQANADSPLMLRFSEPVRGGTGRLLIRASDGSVVRSLDPQTAVISGSEVRFALEPALPAGRSFRLSSEGQPFVDLPGNAWVGLNAGPIYGFTTAAQRQQDADGSIRLESELGNLRLKDDQGQPLVFSGDFLRRSLALVTPQTPWTDAARQLLDRYRFYSNDSSSTAVSTDNAAFLDFSVRASSLQAVTVEIDLASEVRANAYVKINPNTGEAFDFTYDPATGLGAELLDRNSNGLVDRLRIHLRDGARGDLDGVVNGEIRDPGALAEAPRTPVYRFYKNGIHFYTNNVAERDSVIANSYASGVNYATLSPNPASRDPITGGWGYRFEGVAYQSLDTQGTALHRFYSPSKSYHFMTTSAAEAQTVIQNSVGGAYNLNDAAGKPLLTNGWGYQYEGTSYRVSTISQLGMNNPVYRFYNVTKGVHFYSSDLAEVKTVISNSVGPQYANDLSAALARPALLPNGWQYQFEGVGWYV